MNQVKFERIILFFVFFHIALGVFLSHYNLNYFESIYVREDGFIEWLTVDVLLFGSILCFVRAFRTRFRKGTAFFMVLVACGVVLLFGAGEEISWGQRILDIKSSEFFLLKNSQGETNLHNLVINGIKVNKLIFGTILGILIGLYFIVLPILYKFVNGIKKLTDKFAIPVPRVLHILAYVLLAIMATFTASGKKGELLEFGGCWIFFLMFLFPVNKNIFEK